ncbi:hypothetical protein OQA88_9114 [Cercophora sp. LCS_1]
MTLHRVLDPSRKEVRLLVLHAGADDEIPSCDLSTASLLDNPEYEALSYRWVRTPECAIQVNGTPFTIGQNLFDALKRLRYSDKPRTIWVDTICINQRDNAEKSTQLSLMSDIYSKSSQGLLWLGEEPEAPVPTVTEEQHKEVEETIHDIDRFLQDLAAKMQTWEPIPGEPPSTFSDDIQKMIKEMPQAEPDAFRITRTRPCTWYGDDRDAARLATTTDPSTFADSVFHAFALFRMLSQDLHLSSIPYLVSEPPDQHTHLTNAKRAAHWLATRDWWSRIWMVQEAVLPPTSTLLYGPVSMPWTTMLDGILNFRRHRDTCCSGVPGIENILNMHAEILSELRSVRLARDAGEPITLARLLPKFRHRHAEYPRDKVYALLPLVTDWYGAPPLIPSYDKTVVEVYTDTVVHIVRASKRLDIMYRPPETSVERRLEGLPSWVPDWSQGAAGATLDRFDKQLPLYNACRSVSADVVGVFDEGKVLALEGVRVDRLRRASTTMMSWSSWPERDTLEWWYHVAEEETGGDDQWKGMFWRTLCGDSMMDDGNHGDGPLVKFRRAVETDEERLKAWCQAEDMLEGFRGDAASTGSGGHEGVSRVVKTTTQTRVFAVTESRRLALVPNMAQMVFPRPDEFFLCAGGRMPIIMRSVGTRDIPGLGEKQCYAFLGDCYLHGMMDGEGEGLLKDKKETIYVV